MYYFGTVEVQKWWFKKSVMYFSGVFDPFFKGVQQPIMYTVKSLVFIHPFVTLQMHIEFVTRWT